MFVNEFDAFDALVYREYVGTGSDTNGAEMWLVRVEWVKLITHLDLITENFGSISEFLTLN